MEEDTLDKMVVLVVLVVVLLDMVTPMQTLLQPKHLLMGFHQLFKVIWVDLLLAIMVLPAAVVPVVPVFLHLDSMVVPVVLDYQILSELVYLSIMLVVAVVLDTHLHLGTL